LEQDHTEALKLLTKSADLGFSQAHCHLGDIYREERNMKAKFHYEAAAMAGHDGTRNNLGYIKFNSGNKEQALKHIRIAAAAGNCIAMFGLITCFEQGLMPQEAIDSTLEAYNNSCAKMRSKARDACI
jgi:TPR repeat protein